MEITALLLSISSFIVIILVYLALTSFLSSRQKEQNVLKRASKWSSLSVSSEDSIAADQSDPKSWKFSLPNFFKKSNKNTTASYFADTPLFYQRAGIYDRKAIRSYQALRVILLVAPFIVLALAYYLYNQVLNQKTLLMTVAASGFAYFLPVLWLKAVAYYRKKDLYRTFPDAIDLLMVCVEAGMGVDSAIKRVSKEIVVASPELAKEFKILSLELKAGKSRDVCFKNLAMRTDLKDVDSLVSLMVQAERYGTGVANALRIHAEEMREKRINRLEELAAKLPVKLVVPLVLLIFPALFVVILGPAIIQIFRSLIQR